MHGRILNVLAPLVRHRAAMAAFAGGVLLASFALPSFVQPTFRVQARLGLSVPPVRQRFDPEQIALRPGVAIGPKDREWFLFQERERLAGAALRARVAEELGLDPIRLQNLRVEPIRQGDGSVLLLSLESEDPALAAGALARFLGLAEETAPELPLGLDPLEELGQALERAREALAQAEKGLRELEAGGSLALLQERLAAQAREREAATDSLAQAEAELQARRASLATLVRQIDGIPQMILEADTRDLASPPPDLRILEERLRLLRAEEAELLGRFPRESEPVQDAQRKIQAAEASLERLLSPARTRRVLNPLRQALQERLLVEQAEVPALEARVAEGIRRRRGLVEEQEQGQKRLAELLPQVESLREERRQRIQEIARLERLRRTLEGTLSSARIVHQVLEPPLKPLYPFRPDRGRILLLGLIAALVGAPGLAIVMDRVAGRGGRARREGGA